jgi:hypothetical protein
MDQQNLFRLGTWLRRRYQDAQNKIVIAKDTLYSLNVPLDDLTGLSADWDEAKQYYQAQVPGKFDMPFLDV